LVRSIGSAFDRSIFRRKAGFISASTGGPHRSQRDDVQAKTELLKLAMDGGSCIGGSAGGVAWAACTNASGHGCLSRPRWPLEGCYLRPSRRRRKENAVLAMVGSDGSREGFGQLHETTSNWRRSLSQRGIFRSRNIRPAQPRVLRGFASCTSGFFVRPLMPCTECRPLRNAVDQGPSRQLSYGKPKNAGIRDLRRWLTCRPPLPPG